MKKCQSVYKQTDTFFLPVFCFISPFHLHLQKRFPIFISLFFISDGYRKYIRQPSAMFPITIGNLFDPCQNKITTAEKQK